MLTRLKQDLIKQKTISSLHTFDQGDSGSESEEDEDYTWEPSDTLTDTLKTLSLFSDMKDMDRREIKDSYANFDAWLKSEIYRIVSIEKGKEDESVWGDLQ